MLLRFSWRQGLDPNDTTARGKTPLHLAAETGSVEVCKILLAAGADPMFPDQDDTTAIGVAIQEGHTGVVRLFADTDLKISSGNLYDAALHSHTEITAILLDAMKNVDARNDYSGTPLHLAITVAQQTGPGPGNG